MADKKFYITKQKLKELQKEYKDLLYFLHMKTKAETPKFLESEDLNSEYFTLQEDLNFLRNRINELENVLKNYELITPPTKEKQKNINLGARVIVEVDGEKDEFTIVGTIEANPSLGKISNESPVGRALLGHKVGEEIIVSSPIKVVYKIKKISYPSGR